MKWTIFKKTLKNTIQTKNELIAFDGSIADLLRNKKINPIVTELSIRGRKLNIVLVLITKSCFSVPKTLN